MLMGHRGTHILSILRDSEKNISMENMQNLSVLINDDLPLTTGLGTTIPYIWRVNLDFKLLE